MISSDNTEKAREFALERHNGQYRDDGSTYFHGHIDVVAHLVGMVTTDEDVICAAYLHDTLEDIDTTIVELSAYFGRRVSDMVFELTHVGSREEGFTFPNLHSREAIMIKFADRLSNLSDMGVWPQERQDAYLAKSMFWINKTNTKA